MPTPGGEVADSERGAERAQAYTLSIKNRFLAGDAKLRFRGLRDIANFVGKRKKLIAPAADKVGLVLAGNRRIAKGLTGIINPDQLASIDQFMDLPINSPQAEARVVRPRGLVNFLRRQRTTRLPQRFADSTPLPRLSDNFSRR